MADVRSANGEGIGTLAETRSVVSGELGAGAGTSSADPPPDASVGGAECGELSDCGGGSGSRGGSGRLLVAAPRTSGGGVAEVRPVRTGGGGGRLRGLGTAVLISLTPSGVGLGTEGRGGALTVGAGASPGSVPSLVAAAEAGGAEAGGAEAGGFVGEAVWPA